MAGPRTECFTLSFRGLRGSTFDTVSARYREQHTEADRRTHESVVADGDEFAEGVGCDAVGMRALRPVIGIIRVGDV